MYHFCERNCPPSYLFKWTGGLSSRFCDNLDLMGDKTLMIETKKVQVCELNPRTNSVPDLLQIWMCLVSSRHVTVGINLCDFIKDKTPREKKSKWLLVLSLWHIPHSSETDSSFHGPFRTIYFYFYSWSRLPSSGSKLAICMDFCRCKSLLELGKEFFLSLSAMTFLVEWWGCGFSSAAICLLIFILILIQWGSFSF